MTLREPMTWIFFQIAAVTMTAGDPAISHVPRSAKLRGRTCEIGKFFVSVQDESEQDDNRNNSPNDDRSDEPDVFQFEWDETLQPGLNWYEFLLSPWA